MIYFKSLTDWARRNTLIILAEFRIALSYEFQYRWQVFMWVVGDMVQPLMFALLWSAVASNGNRAFTGSDMISYYFMVAIVSRLTQDWSIQFVSNSIIDADFAKYLLKPYNYLAEMFGISLAIRTLRILLLVPFLTAGYFFLGDRLSYSSDPVEILLFPVAIVLGFMINFLLGNIFALVAFFIRQVVGLRSLYTNLLSILSGEYIPFMVLGTGLVFLLNLMPFRYVLSFPVEIISGSLTRGELQNGFVIGSMWLIGLMFCYQVIYSYAIKKYEAEGN